MARPVLTLLTDFGLKDPFIGIMKGVIARHSTDILVVDLTHGIEPQAVHQGAFWLEKSYSWFPPGTVHVVVVDPGVGSQRRVLLAVAAGHYFVAPDNGVLSRIIAKENCQIRSLPASSELFPRPHGPTFDGRDVFSPLGARLALDPQSFTSIGEPCAHPILLDSQQSDNPKQGSVVVVDHFGNLITTFTSDEVEGTRQVECRGRFIPVVDRYGDVDDGALLALVNSHGTLEIAVRNGDASRLLQAGVGTEVNLK